VRQAWCRSLPASASVVGHPTPWKGACDPLGCAGRRETLRAYDSQRATGAWQQPIPRPLRIAFRWAWSSGSGEGGCQAETVMASLPRSRGRLGGSTRRGGDTVVWSGVRRLRGRMMEGETQLGCMRRTPTASIVGRPMFCCWVGRFGGRAAVASAATAQALARWTHSAVHDAKPHRS
jgi:hypothetical protein